MLHMVVMTHNPESCGTHPHLREAYGAAAARAQELATEKGITLQNTWVNMPEHMIFTLVDAPNAHLIMEMLVESGTIAHQNVRILPVISGEQASQRAGITPPQ